MNKIIGILSVILLFACTPSGIKENPKKDKRTKVLKIDGDYQVVAKKRLENGLSFAWYKIGNGEVLEDGDLVMIDYKVKLKDGSVVDGNHLLKEANYPF